MISADTNLFLYAANSASPHHQAAMGFFHSVATNPDFVVCELVLVEIYMQLRNPSVMRKPLDAQAAAKFCGTLKTHPVWQQVDYVGDISNDLWKWATTNTRGFRHIIDARLALTLVHHGVTDFATANVKDFQSFSFRKVWFPLSS